MNELQIERKQVQPSTQQRKCGCVGYWAEPHRVFPRHITGSNIAHSKSCSLAPICKLRIEWSHTRKRDSFPRTSSEPPSASEKKKKKEKRDNFHKGGSWKLSSGKDSACQSAPSVFVGMTGTYSVEKHWWLFWLQWLHFRVLMCGYYKGRLVFTVEFLVWNKCQISRVLYFPQQWQCVPWQYHSYSQGRMLTLILGVKLMGW